MKIENVKEIIDRKSSIPMENESFELISEAYDIASELIDKAIPKLIKSEKNFKSCPKCNEVLNNDCGERYKHCPDCGQALIWQ